MEKHSIQEKAGMYEGKQGMSTEVKAEGWETEVMTELAPFTSLNFSSKLSGYTLLSVPNPNGVAGSTRAHDSSAIQVVMQSGREGEAHRSLHFQSLLSHFNCGSNLHPLPISCLKASCNWHCWFKPLIRETEPDNNLEGKENKNFLTKAKKKKKKRLGCMWEEGVY